MGRKMSRGKQQVLFNYLPGKTFDFERVATIARVVSIRGVPRTDLNVAVLLRKVTEEVQAWHEDFRPALRDDVLGQASRFILLDPKDVQAEMFPKLLWCQRGGCNRLFDFSHRDPIPNTCPVCRQDELMQLRFIQIHRCGALHQLSPYCPSCKSSNQMALNTRGSERISSFQWICRGCQHTYTTNELFHRPCRECSWPNPNQRHIDIEVHRAGRTFYAHTAVLLNIPHRRLDAFFSLSQWQAIAAARFFGLPEVVNRPLSDFAPTVSAGQAASDSGLPGADLDDLFRRQASGELTAEQMVAEMRGLRQQRQIEQQASSPTGIVQALTQRTGVPWPTWEQAGQEMLEAVMPLESGQPKKLYDQMPSSSAVQTARRMGLSSLTLVTDFPIVTATYGYSRAEYTPKQCRLNPFPPERDHGGKFPIFVDQVQADALLLSLDPERVCIWLERNGLTPTLPSGSDPSLAQRAYFVQLFDNISLRETLDASRPEVRMVFNLLHTFSHLCVRQAALLCGLDSTSLSEYLLPRALTFALYCNHRFGATIGALTALFEQSLAEWLNAVRDARRCVYDPVCRNHEGSCHACTYLAETSCRFFNLNLGRSFLFGGPDPELAQVLIGYFDLPLNLA
jgi:hypothetical protein